MFIIVTVLATLTGCKKYLDEKSDKKQVIPSSLEDLQALLDNFSILNTGNPSSGEASADDYYLTDQDWASLPNEFDRRKYIWQKDNLFATGDKGNEWGGCYKAVYYSNIVLNEIEKVESSLATQLDWNNVKGQALFHRANRILGALQVWSPAFDANTAQTGLGLPLRLDPDFNVKSIRSSVSESYNQVIHDLKNSVPLLPINPKTLYRPSKAAAYGLLARTFLAIQDYPNAILYSDSCLNLNKELLDYRSLNSAATYPIAKLNKETIFYASLSPSDLLSISRAKIDKNLYDSYSVNDARKNVYFRSNGNATYAFKGNYTGGSSLFGGIATDEIYLIKAESLARQNKIDESMRLLNDLLVKRWKVDANTGASLYINQSAINKDDALTKILAERRKELVFRGIRWMDIKRLNKLGANITISKTINGQSYGLMANDLRFALPIPEDVITTSGMTQNPR